VRTPPPALSKARAIIIPSAEANLKKRAAPTRAAPQLFPTCVPFVKVKEIHPLPQVVLTRFTIYDQNIFVIAADIVVAHPWMPL